MDCRLGCGACCIVPSISSPIPGMPGGKPAFTRCIQLSSENTCLIFGKPERPAVCVSLRPAMDLCGNRNEEAFVILERLERLTSTELKALEQQIPD